MVSSENLVIKMKKLITLSIVLLSSTVGFSQNEVIQVQPSIMVLPYTNSGQNALLEYEQKQEFKSIVATINSSFQDRNFYPKDLQETVNQVIKNKGINSLENLNFDIVEEILAEARPDILVKVQIYIHPNGSGKSIQIILNAIEVSSRRPLSTMPQIDSPHFQTDDYGYIVNRLLKQDNNIENFINKLNVAFGETVTKGQAITIIIQSPNESNFKLNDEIGDNFDTVSDLITDWIKKNAYKNQYRLGRSDKQTLTFDEIRIPLRDENGNNYNIQEFEKSLRKAIRVIIAKKDGKGAQFSPIINEGTIKIMLP